MDWISLQSKGLSRVFSNTTVQKYQFFGAQLSFTVQLSHPYMTTGKTIALTRWTFVGKVICLLFNMLSRLVKTFLPRSKHLLISSSLKFFKYVPCTWTTRRSNQSSLEEISPGYSLEGMMLKLKLQYFGHLMRRVDSL